MRLSELVVLAAVLVTPVTPDPSLPGAPPPGPALVVLVTVDQMRGDYLTRWAGQWSGGYRRLLEHGAVFTHGMQDHAVTSTAPGHSTLLSGREPAHTGIVLNELGVPDSSVSILGAPGATGASPRRFVGTTLADWLAGSDSGFRFLSVSDKDRAAILPIGRSRGPVYWFVGDRFTTST
ncbi:MAG TPA: alkaline phosphatase family protein, partial [Gemmatimonadales bacterium]|nr:alkaline phosphatase family protein [Gemmatimonadales bacterium]